MENLEKIKNFKGTNETKIKNSGKNSTNNSMLNSKLQTPNSYHSSLTTHISGITLIALVVTIVILLILAAITINLVLAEGGLFERAQKAKDDQRVAEILDQLTIAETAVSIDKLGKPSLEDYKTEILKEGIVIEVEGPENGNMFAITEDGYEIEIYIKEGTTVNDIIIGNIQKVENLQPKIGNINPIEITETSITVKAQVWRAEEENIKYYYKEKDINEEYKEMVKTEYGATQTGLKNNTTYVIKVVATNENTGEEGVTKEVEITTGMILIQSIELDKTEAEVVQGKTLELTATILPENVTKQELEWTSSNIEVATINGTGKTITVTASINTIGETTITAKTTDGSNLTATCTVEVIEIANAPDVEGFVDANTYYVTWNSEVDENNMYTISETAITGAEPSNWYDYTAGVNQWANIKTTGGDNDCYWVWIPRYAYKVPTRSSTAQTIEVKFLEGITNKPIGETEKITNTTPTEGSWVVHPAFTNSGNGGFGELEGIWVAKFEASSSNVSEETVTADLATTGGGDTADLNVRVIPNVTSWRGITVNNIFTVCQNLTLEGNSLYGTTNIDSHMMKNTEWGAVAYLSRSAYGKGSAVYNNPYYNNTTNYSPITGLCGTAQNSSQTSLTNTYKYNQNEGTDKTGTNASTTGNVYGVYDMAGGAFEYVAGILSSKKSNSTYYDFSDTKYTKYFDWYTNYDSTKYGDAVYETSSSSSGTTSWDSDYSDFVSSSKPVCARGGRSWHGSNAGVFAFTTNTGGTQTFGGFRPCLVSPQS